VVAVGSGDSHQSVGGKFRWSGWRQISDLEEIRVFQPTFPNYVGPSVLLAINRNLRTRRSAQRCG
jgi:hypothetical protein